MTTKQIIFVPGKNPKPEPAQHRALLWRTLVEGVRRADSAVAETLQGGYPQFHLVGWNHLYYHLHKDITGVLKEPALNAKLSAEGAPPVGSTSDEFSKFIREELVKWAAAVKQSGARVD